MLAMFPHRHTQHVVVNASDLIHLQAVVRLTTQRKFAVLLKLSEWPLASAAPPPGPRDKTVQLSGGCSPHDEEPSCSIQTHKCAHDSKHLHCGYNAMKQLKHCTQQVFIR